MALIHRSAAIANFAKAQRMDQAARIETETHLLKAKRKLEELEAALCAKHETTIAPSESQSNEETEIPTIFINTESMTMAPSPSASGMETATAAPLEATSPSTPPPFAMAAPNPTIDAAPNSFDPIVETYANPPAFLLRKDAEIPEAFAWADESTMPIEDEAPARARRLAISAFLSSGTAVWIATTIALASGVYLFIEGRKAIEPAAPVTSEPTKEVPPAAEAVPAAASSAARAAPRKLVIVRIDRAALRANPTADASTIQTVGLSTVFTVLEERDGWIHVEGAKVKGADRRAWISTDAITRLPN
jgi:hypothetical protein